MMIEEQDFVTDDDSDEIYAEERVHRPQALAPAAHPITANVGGLPVYPLALAQSGSLGQAASGDSLLTRKVGPLPVWGWALTALGTGIGGYFWWQAQQQKTISKNDGAENDDPARELPESTAGGGAWNPSRGAFAEQLNKHFMRKGMADKVKIFDDADEAKKKLKHVSPLLNIKCEVSYKPDKDLERLCKREGLSPIVHDDGTIGLYPAGSGKRATEWEKYIDLLRDDGQTV